MSDEKQPYVEPELDKHEQIQDVTAGVVPVVSGFNGD